MKKAPFTITSNGCLSFEIISETELYPGQSRSLCIFFKQLRLVVNEVCLVILRSQVYTKQKEENVIFSVHRTLSGFKVIPFE